MARARDETLIRDKVEFFRKSAFWPLSAGLDGDGWLDNFKPHEKTVALALLDAFVYFPPDMTTTILASEFHRLSSVVGPADLSLRERQSLWDQFREDVVITYPTDEQPGATDSGRSYLRKARGVLGLRQNQYADPADAVARLAQKPGTPLVLIDDFVGTGSQVLQSWNRQYKVPGGA